MLHEISPWYHREREVSSMKHEEVARRYGTLITQVDKVARSVGKTGQDITIVVAAKYGTDNQIIELGSQPGIIFGENRVSDLLTHQSCVDQRPTTNPSIPLRASDQRPIWHFIGHLQTNKINKVVGKISMLQSLDSLHLAQALDKRLKILKLPKFPILIEINIARDPKKFGIDPAKLFDFLSSLSPYSLLSIEGLMTMGKVWENEKEARVHFAKMRKLFEKLQTIKQPNLRPRYLSMGMSSDYQWAIEEGATMIRVGRALFK